jgi:tRNA threonylcarbamoyl adenosine modification protein YeaZ
VELVIESAGPACSAALLQSGAVVDERHETVGRGHAERLVPMIAELLDGRRPDAILVDCGPGSFTGVRVGLAAAHGLTIGWGIALSGFSSTALAAAAAGPYGDIAVALAGGHGQLFVQSFADDPLRPLDALRSLAPAEAAAVIRAERVAGSGAGELVAARGWGTAIEVFPRAAEAAKLPPALRSLAPSPIYGRAPDAKPLR